MIALPWSGGTRKAGAVKDSVAALSFERNRAVWSTLLAYASFAVAGVGCALPGALLPALQASWHVHDSGAGVFFLVIATGSALGALMLLRQLWRSLLLAFGLLTFTSVIWASTHPLGVVFGLAWGLGLGMLTTGISLMLQGSTAAHREIELVRLNLLWAAGACLCPVLMTHALRTNSPRGVLLVFAALFAVLGLATAALHSPVSMTTKRKPASLSRSALAARFSLGGIPLALILATVLSTGIEASGGAWLASYARRSHGGLAMTIAAPTCLWGGLLLSRSLASLPAAGPLSRRSLHGLLILVAVTAGCLLIPSGWALAFSAFGLGFGLGPLYPSLLARVMDQRQNGSIFFLCGVASAVLPLTTGLVSYHFASLRAGLAVPATAAVVMMLAGLRCCRVPEGASA